MRRRPVWRGVGGWGMPEGVSGRRLGRVELGATGIALTALVGEWLAHTLEYMRVSGLRGAFGSVHIYMGPVGAVLVVAALAAVHSTVRLVRVVQRRLVELRHIEARGLNVVPSRASPAPARSWGVPALVGVVWATQCGLYLLQENFEAHAARLGTPGLAVMGGEHALVLLVHLAVVLALVAVLWAARRQVTRLARVVALVEVRLRLARRGAATVVPRPTVRTWTPADRWGMQLWSRPPPTPRVA